MNFDTNGKNIRENLEIRNLDVIHKWLFHGRSGPKERKVQEKKIIIIIINRKPEKNEASVSFDFLRVQPAARHS